MHFKAAVMHFLGRNMQQPLQQSNLVMMQQQQQQHAEDAPKAFPTHQQFFCLDLLTSSMLTTFSSRVPLVKSLVCFMTAALQAFT